MKSFIHQIVNISILSLILFLTAPSAHATNKIDTFSPATDYNEDVNQTKSKKENAYGKAVAKLRAKVKSAFGAEGAAMFDALGIPTNLSDWKKVGMNIYSGNFNVLDNLRLASPQLNNLRLDHDSLERLRLDHLRALEKERAAKLEAINQRIMEIDKLIEAAPYAENVAELNEEKKLLTSQKIKLEASQNVLDPQTSKFDARLAKANKDMRSLMSDIDSGQLQNRFNKTIDAELGKLNMHIDGDDDGEDMYDDAIGKFFLSQGKRLASENVAAMKKEREKAYYEAEIEAMTLGTETFRKAAEIAERMKKLRSGSTTTDGIFGAKNMNVGLDIENARMAALYTKLLLAKIKLETTRDLRSRTNTYRLFGSRKPTEFNLENYEYKKKGLIGGLWSKGVNAGMNAGYGALGLK